MRGSLIEPFTCGYYAVLRSGGTNASGDGGRVRRRHHRPRFGGGGIGMGAASSSSTRSRRAATLR
jgi:hypothetical protein